MARASTADSEDWTKLSGDGMPDFVGQAREIREEVGALAGSLETAAGDWGRFLAREMKSHPYRSMAVAAFAGYVVGTALPAGTVRTAAGVGGRIVLLRFVQHLVNDALQGADAIADVVETG